MRLSCFIKRFRINTLRSFITFAVSITVAVSLLGSGIFFYKKSADTLKDSYQEDIIRQLQQINKQVGDQIHIIDSIYPLLMSNTLIREYLDPASDPYTLRTPVEKRLDIQRQMSYLLISNFLWDEKFINSVTIFQLDGTYIRVSLYEDHPYQSSRIQSVYEQISPDSVALEIKTLDSDNQSIYFARNIKSTYTGESIATMIIDINQEAWKNVYSENTDENWLICIFNKDMQVLSHEDSKTAVPYQAIIQSAGTHQGIFRELTIDHTRYYMASEEVGTGGITSAVAVPELYLMQELNEVLKTYVMILLIIVCITLTFTFVLSHLITTPIEKMILHIKSIASGQQTYQTRPPASLYSEFNDLANAFEQMLKQLDLYYHDIFQKQLLLKNAELKALQSQMDPHFLFNVLDTIAWKAQMTDNEEIYQMIISLGELLRSNILSQEKDFVTLEEELEYVRFYIYLQQTRFEDKFTAEIHTDPSINRCLVPRFCIQPLVENAIVHGLEPKKGYGKLMLNVIDQGTMIEVNVADNGVGFLVPDDMDSFTANKEDSHTHIGLKNLNKRLTLLYGPGGGLQMTSSTNRCTTATFKIPKKEGEGL